MTPILAEYNIRISAPVGSEDALDSALDALEQGGAEDKVQAVGDQLLELVAPHLPGASVEVDP